MWPELGSGPAENGTSSGADFSHSALASLSGRVQPAAGADQGVAADQVQAEPGGLEAAVHDVEPDRDLGELDGGLVQVDAVAVVQGDVGLDLLQGEGALVRFEAIVGLFLAQPQVQGGELVDGLVEERAGAERGLADPPAQDLGGR